MHFLSSQKELTKSCAIDFCLEVSRIMKKKILRSLIFDHEIMMIPEDDAGMNPPIMIFCGRMAIKYPDKRK